MHRVILVGPHLNDRGGVSVVQANLIEAFKDEGVDVFHVATSEPGKLKVVSFLLSFFKIIFLLGKNTQLILNVSPRGSIVRKTILCVCFSPFCNVYSILHSIDFRDRNYLYEFCIKLFSKLGRLVVLSGYWKEVISNLYFDGESEGILVIENPVVIPSQNEFSEEGYILTMTRLVKGKGIEKLISYFEGEEPGRLVIAGDGPMLDEYKRLASSVSPSIQFFGWVDGSEKKSLLKGASGFCLLSEYDSFGMGYIEAMSYGKEIICLDRPVYRSSFGSQPFIHYVSSHSDFRIAVRDIGKNSKPLLIVKFIEDNFSGKVIVKKWLDNFEDA